MLLKRENVKIGNTITLKDTKESTNIEKYVTNIAHILNKEVDFLDDLVSKLPTDTETQLIAYRLLNTLRKLSKVDL